MQLVVAVLQNPIATYTDRAALANGDSEGCPVWVAQTVRFLGAVVVFQVGHRVPFQLLDTWYLRGGSGWLFGEYFRPDSAGLFLGGVLSRKACPVAVRVPAANT